MVTRSNVRLGLTGAVLMMIFGAFAGCSESPLAPAEGFETQALMDEKADASECVIINGVVHCAPDHLEGD